MQLTETGDFVGCLQVAIAVLMAMFPFFLFCHFGGNITQQFEDIGDAVYQLEWYRLPLDMQKDIRMMIALAQKRIYMRGYSDTRTTHSVFKKVSILISFRKGKRSKTAATLIFVCSLHEHSDFKE